MGSEARTTLTLGRRVFAGTAHLDSAAAEAGLVSTKVVRFSGTDTAEKLVIPRPQR